MCNINACVHKFFAIVKLSAIVIGKLIHVQTGNTNNHMVLNLRRSLLSNFDEF